MDNKAIKESIKSLKEKYPHLEEITINYYGSGDSFDSMFSNQEGVDSSDYEDLVFELIDRVGSDFNNDGSEGQIVINLKQEKVKIEDYYRFTEIGLNNKLEL